MPKKELEQLNVPKDFFKQFKNKDQFNDFFAPFLSGCISTFINLHQPYQPHQPHQPSSTLSTSSTFINLINLHQPHQPSSTFINLINLINLHQPHQPHQPSSTSSTLSTLINLMCCCFFFPHENLRHQYFIDFTFIHIYNFKPMAFGLQEIAGFGDFAQFVQDKTG